MLRLLFVLVLVAPLGASADTVSVVVATADAPLAAKAPVVAAAAERGLRELTALTLKPVKSSAPIRPCGEDPTCFTQLAASLGANYVLILTVTGAPANANVEAVFVDVARKKLKQQRASSVRLEAADEALRTLLAGAVPTWVRRGWGAVRLDAGSGVKLRADGRVIPVSNLTEPFPLTAGRHELDVTFPSGTAVLRSVEVPEGEIFALAAEEPRGATAGPKSRGNDGLQLAAAGLWSSGALAVAGSLVAGALAVSAAQTLQACTNQSRECLQIDSAQVQAARVQSYNRTANLLMISGASLATLGAGLYGLDVLLRPKPAAAAP